MSGLLRICTAGSVDDGKSTLIGRLLLDSKALLTDQMSQVAEASRRRGLGHTDLSLVTDGLRALLLESENYATQVFEFVSLEHTSKNKMILAVKRPVPKPPGPIWEQIDQVKAFYGIQEHCLERLVRADPAC